MTNSVKLGAIAAGMFVKEFLSPALAVAETPCIERNVSTGAYIGIDAGVVNRNRNSSFHGSSFGAEINLEQGTVRISHNDELEAKGSALSLAGSIGGRIQTPSPVGISAEVGVNFPLTTTNSNFDFTSGFNARLGFDVRMGRVMGLNGGVRAGNQTRNVFCAPITQ